MTHSISYLKNVWDIDNPIQKDLDDFLYTIQKCTFQKEISELQEIRVKSEEKYQEAKPKKLPVAMLNGTFTKASNDAFIGSSGLFNIDIDKLSGDMEDHKRTIIDALPSVVYCFTSPSNAGIKVGLRIDPDKIKSDADFKSYFPQIRKLFKFLDYKIDENCKDIKRACFVSADADIYINYNAIRLDLITPALAVVPEVQQQSVHAPQIKNDNCIAIVVNLLKQAHAGERHQFRIKAGKLAGGYIAGGLVDEEAILSELIKASDRIADGGITSRSELNTMLDAIEHGKQTPIYTLSNSVEAMFDSAVSYAQDVRDGTATTHAHTELGNAKRLRDNYGQTSKFITGTGGTSFLHWIGDRYIVDTDGALMRANAALLPEQIYTEGLAYKEQAVRFAMWSRASQSRRIMDNAISLFSDFNEVRLSANCIDANTLSIGVNSAREVIELGTGIYRAATQDDYITKSVNATALGNSFEATRWIKFIDEIFGGDAELVDWVQRWCGYLLSGSTQEQMFVFCWGSGSNGKSVFIEMLKHLLGNYAKAIQPEMLANNQRTAGSATPELAALKGVRLALATETEEGVQLAESLIKSLTGGDTIVARPLYGTPIEYIPQFKIMLTGNHKPQIRGNDDGIWRRVRLLHFTQKFSKENCDPFLLTKLKAESNHILAWLVDGHSAWQKRGLKDTPKSIETATADYRSDQDIVGRWIDERCEMDDKAETTATMLYQSYSLWCDENGLKRSSNVVLSRRLEDRGLTKRHSRSGNVYDGICCLPYGMSDGSTPTEEIPF